VALFVDAVKPKLRELAEELIRLHGIQGVVITPAEGHAALVPSLAELPGQLSSVLARARKELTQVHLLTSGEAVAVALFVGAVKPKLRELAEELIRLHGIQGVVITPAEGHAELVGDPVLSTAAPLRPDARLFLRPDAFSQANAEANALLVEAAVELLEPAPEDAALELYAGNGNFSLGLSARVRELVAVEFAPVSVALGQRGAREARAANLRFVQGDSGKVAEGLVREGRRFDLLLADPPRTGAPGIGRWAAELGVRRVVYVACDAAALARDAKALSACGFQPTRLRVIDQFPQTHHVEAVMSFSRATP
jgi:23S rRNA (uracil1939-C5)-methyltransferase